MNQIERIKEKLVRLKEVDSIYQIFGAGKHQCYLNPTKTEGELVTFERIHKIQLPASYRAFLAQVGNGGAGSYYGLEPLENSQYEDLDSHNQAYLIDLSQPFPHTEPWNLDFGNLLRKERLMKNPNTKSATKYTTIASGLMGYCE